ncbi:hypothetical protein J8F10_08865 [Gemmata sp. G18]|uniref:Phage tail assembly chaperone n=1 Tax=Gemmata palustris TaxID=2822762 RepID=A0ABS5BNT9_9BACT|nr:hypothetical protein [Gemmata palustris]MBP3955390.1 hypothetical protein [Gemmata palustris]
MLRWPPDAFWRATTWDVMRAQAGYLASKGVKREGGGKAGLTGEDVKSLKSFMERVEREDAQRKRVA